MCHRWLPFILLLVGTKISAQPFLDSLQRLYNNAIADKDQIKAGIYMSEIGKYYLFIPDVEKSLPAYRTALQLNRQIQNDSMIGANLNDIGGLYYKQGNLDSAFYYYNSSIDVFNKLGDANKTSFLEINLAALYREKGIYEKALALLFSAATKLERQQPDHPLAKCYNSMGITYRLDKDYEKSLFYHKKALQVRQLKNDFSGIGGSFNNIGNVFVDLRQLDSALHYFLKSLEVKRNVNDKRSVASTLNNIGDVRLAQGEPVDAQKYYVESLTLKQQSNDRVGQVITLNGLAECMLLLKQYTAVLKYLNQADDLEKQMGGLLEQYKNNLQIRVRLYRMTGQYREATEFSEKLMKVNDSLYNQDKVSTIQRIQASYEVDKKEQQIEILHADQKLNQAALHTQSLWITILIVTVILTSIITGLIYNNFHAARKNRNRIETLMRELHHRVKNNLQILSSLISLQSQNLTDENAILSAKSTESRINAMALIHRKLYTDTHNTIVSTRGYFRELIEYLVSSYNVTNQQLVLSLDIDEVEVDVDKAIRMGLIVNELISNAFKHAYAGASNAELAILVKQHGLHLHITVKDNGPGLPTNRNNEEEKFGARMVAMLVKELKGSYATQSAVGTTHLLTFPLQ